MKSKFDSRKHHRRSIRLKGYDYASEGAYYVTIVTYERECLFGEIIDNEMYLSTYGAIVQKWWNEILIHFPNIDLGAFVVMPNHIHGIIVITAERRGEVVSPRNDPDQNNQQITNNNDVHYQTEEFMEIGCQKPGREDPAPTSTYIGTNHCLLQISIYKRNERI